VILPLKWGAGKVDDKGSLNSGFLISTFLIGFGNNIASIPIIPDIIMEED